MDLPGVTELCLCCGEPIDIGETLERWEFILCAECAEDMGIDDDYAELN